MESSLLKQMGLDAALVLAAETEDLSRLARLLEAGANPKAAPVQGRTALMAAAKAGRLEAAKLLLPLSDHAQIDSNGESPLTLAASSRAPEMASLLLPNFNPNHVNAAGMTALMIAAERDAPETIKALLQKADPDLRGRHDSSALHIAAAEDCVKALLALLEKCDPNARDAEGSTPLITALENGSAAAARLLAPLTNLSLQTQDGYIALDIARYSQNLESAERAELFGLIQAIQLEQKAIEERSELSAAARPALRPSASAPRV